MDNKLICKFPRERELEQSLRREARLLAVIAPRTDLPVPRLTLVDDGSVWSIHAKIAGGYLLRDTYRELDEAARNRLAATLGRFYAQLHAIDTDLLRAAGATPLLPWMTPDQVLQTALPLLPPGLRPPAAAVVRRWQALGPDPLGDTYGFFDGHGWNMAFDAQTQVLNGIYDFGDSGFGPLHQEFIYADIIDPDLTGRIITAYEAASGRAIDRDRVHVLAGAHRVMEFAAEAGDPDSRAIMLAMFERWVAAGEASRGQ